MCYIGCTLTDDYVDDAHATTSSIQRTGHIYLKVASISNWKGDPVEKHLAFGEFWDGGLLLQDNDNGNDNDNALMVDNVVLSTSNADATIASPLPVLPLHQTGKNGAPSMDGYVKATYCYGHAGEWKSERWSGWSPLPNVEEGWGRGGGARARVRVVMGCVVLVA